MRYRKLDANGDYVFGRGQLDFLINTPECVVQAVKTRLGMFVADWYYDRADGTPYREQILGKYTGLTRDQAIRARVADTPGLNDIALYDGSLNRTTREYTVTMVCDTIYGVSKPTPVTVKAATTPTDVRYGR